MRYDRRSKTFLLAAALAAFASVASAQVIGKTMTVAGLPVCNSPKNFGLVTDATNATTLGAGGGSAHVWVTCASGSWAIAEVAAVTDLSAYLPVSATTAAPVVIQVSGAGNDVSLIASDDVILTPTDALTVASGGAASITTTAGAIGLTAGGTTQDITLTSVDDVILAATDDTTVAGDQFAVNTTTAVIDAGGGADEITVAAGSTVFVGLVQITKAASPPVACAAGYEGGLYVDSDTHLLCVCNASAWVQVADGSTGCS